MTTKLLINSITLAGVWAFKGAMTDWRVEPRPLPNAAVTTNSSPNVMMTTSMGSNAFFLDYT